MKKRILIVSFFFWPEQTPRAFRAYELAKEFSKRNFNVTVVTKKLNIERDIKEPFILYEIPISKSNLDLYIPSKLFYQKNSTGFSKHNAKLNYKRIAKIKFPSYLHFWKLIFWPSIWSNEFASKGNYFLTKNLNSEFDLTISVDSFALPSHSLTYKLWRKGKKLGVVIGDSGDPFTFNPNHRFSFNHYFRERKLLTCFDYITVPTSKAIAAFIKLGVKESKIKVIPQGFSFDSAKVPYCDISSKNPDQTTMVYGGKFKPKIRNPENFFDALILLKNKHENIVCKIFTDLRDPYVIYLQEAYGDQLSDTLQFNEIILREEFLTLIREADICLNFVNQSKYQIPSKLIDYALVRAKIIDIHMNMTPEEIVTKIINKEYYTPELDLKYDIRNVADNFLSLV